MTCLRADCGTRVVDDPEADIGAGPVWKAAGKGRVTYSDRSRIIREGTPVVMSSTLSMASTTDAFVGVNQSESNKSPIRTWTGVSPSISGL